MPHPSKRKGDHFERTVAKLFGGERTFFQPEQEDKRGDIINVRYLGKVECKARKNDFKRLYDWLTDVDALAVKSDRKPILMVIRANDILKLIDELDEYKRSGKNDRQL